jgi:hypothetical protein
MQNLLASNNKSSLTFGDSLSKKMDQVSRSPQSKMVGLAISRTRETASPNPKLLFPALKYSDQLACRKLEQRTVNVYGGLQAGTLNPPSVSLLTKGNSTRVRSGDQVRPERILTSTDTSFQSGGKASVPIATDGIPIVTDSKPTDYQSRILTSPSARYLVTSAGGSAARRTPVGRSLFQNFGFRSPGIVTPKKRGEGSDSRVQTPIFSLNRVQTIKVRLQEYLQDFDTKSVVSPKPEADSDKLTKEAAKQPVASITDQQTEDSCECGSSENNNTNNPLGALKELLKNPKQAGTEMTVSQFRQLEANSAVEVRKSCLRTSNSSLKGLKVQSEDLDKRLPKETLKRSVSFSENVVMFIYQA